LWKEHYLSAAFITTPTRKNELLDLDTGANWGDDPARFPPTIRGASVPIPEEPAFDRAVNGPRWQTLIPVNHQSSVLIDHHRTYLYWTYGSTGSIYALAERPEPAFLRLAVGARLIGVTRNGRALFFQRGGWLWRLDFRKPLLQLLEEGPLLTPDQLPERDRITGDRESRP
jgi:hypothetical protein